MSLSIAGCDFGLRWKLQKVLWKYKTIKLVLQLYNILKFFFYELAFNSVDSNVFTTPRLGFNIVLVNYDDPGCLNMETVREKYL